MKRLLALLLVCLIGVAVVAQTEEPEVVVPEPWEFFVGQWQTIPDETSVHVFAIRPNSDYLSVYWYRVDTDDQFQFSFSLGSGKLTLFPSESGELMYGIAALDSTNNNPLYSYLLFERVVRDDVAEDALSLRIFRSVGGSRYGTQLVDYQYSQTIDMILTRVPEAETEE